MKHIKSIPLHLLARLPKAVLELLSIPNQRRLAKWAELHYAKKL